VKAHVSKEIANAVVDPNTYADDDYLQSIFKELRNNAPVAWAEPDGFDPFWIVSRYEDIRRVSLNNSLFASGIRQTTLTSKIELAKVQSMTGGSPFLVKNLINMDGATHKEYRFLTHAWFQSASLRQRADQIKAAALESVIRMAAMDGYCDFAADVAFIYPLHNIMSILGVPQEDEPKILNWTKELLGSDDPEMSRAGAVGRNNAEERLRARLEVFSEFTGYLEALRRARILHPQENDLASIIANSIISGQPISPQMAVNYYLIVATAGHDTTAASIACTMWAFTQNRDLLPKVKARPDLIPGLVEESVRWATPAKHFLRTATSPTQLRGQQIAEGDLLMLCYPSANRDEERFDRPFEFDIERGPGQMAFGYGGHVCLGQHLARMEMISFWDTLIPRLNSVAAAGPSRLVASRLSSGLKTLPIRFETN